MILVDLNQVMISNLMIQLKRSGGVVEEDLVRHMVLNSLKKYRGMFRPKYGELVICCDDTGYWRKDLFPYYKASRKKDRQSPSLDWNSIFVTLNNIRDELRENMPYLVIQVPNAEADHIIATLCQEFGVSTRDQGMPILILSGDKDFVQLQKYWNVDNYNPILKKDVCVDNPERYLREHIMLGDRGDGVPNFLSPDDTFISGKRQKSISRLKLAEWAELEPEDFCTEEMLVGYMRNKALVDLSEIPDNISDQVIEQYAQHHYSGTKNSRSKIIEYFMEKKLRNLMSDVQAFQEVDYGYNSNE